MSGHTRWAVRDKGGQWMGSNRGTIYRSTDGHYQPKPGYDWNKRVEMARLFVRRQDATKAASHYAAEVVPVSVSL